MEAETAAQNSIQTLYKNGDGTEENGVVFFSSVRVCIWDFMVPSPSPV